jgi:hypothetical protein
MRGTQSNKTALATRRVWEPPTVTKLAIDTGTKSARIDCPVVQSDPQPPAAPATKLGFSFEMSLPLASRTGN